MIRVIWFSASLTFYTFKVPTYSKPARYSVDRDDRPISASVVTLILGSIGTIIIIIIITHIPYFTAI
jgi:hypothetical protein